MNKVSIKTITELETNIYEAEILLNKLCERLEAEYKNDEKTQFQIILLSTQASNLLSISKKALELLKINNGATNDNRLN